MPLDQTLIVTLTDPLEELVHQQLLRQRPTIYIRAVMVSITAPVSVL